MPTNRPIPDACPIDRQTDSCGHSSLGRGRLPHLILFWRMAPRIHLASRVHIPSVQPPLYPISCPLAWQMVQPNAKRARAAAARRVAGAVTRGLRLNLTGRAARSSEIRGSESGWMDGVHVHLSKKANYSLSFSLPFLQSRLTIHTTFSPPSVTRIAASSTLDGVGSGERGREGGS